MTMDEDRDGLAAEYVLGTLDADERAQADALLTVDAGFRRGGARSGSAGSASSMSWSRRSSRRRRSGTGSWLRSPPRVRPNRAAAGVASPAAVAAEQGPSAEIIYLTQRMRRWRGLTVMTGALAA